MSVRKLSCKERRLVNCRMLNCSDKNVVYQWQSYQRHFKLKHDESGRKHDSINSYQVIGEIAFANGQKIKKLYNNRFFLSKFFRPTNENDDNGSNSNNDNDNNNEIENNNESENKERENNTSENDNDNDNSANSNDNKFQLCSNTQNLL